MSASKHYVLDANVFIQAHRMYYAFDICPGFWQALIRQFRSGSMCSIDKIKAEIVEEADPLSRWAKETVPEEFFKGTADQRVIDAFGEVVKWAQNESQFTQEAKAVFAREADGWLVAFAKVNGLIVVTHEQFAPKAEARIKIPNVCIEFDVAYCNTFAMLRGVREQFVLKTRRKKR